MLTNGSSSEQHVFRVSVDGETEVSIKLHCEQTLKSKLSELHCKTSFTSRSSLTPKDMVRM